MVGAARRKVSRKKTAREWGLEERRKKPSSPALFVSFALLSCRFVIRRCIIQNINRNQSTYYIYKALQRLNFLSYVFWNKKRDLGKQWKKVRNAGFSWNTSRLRGHKIALQSPTTVKMFMQQINMLLLFFVASNGLKEIYITEAIFLLSKMASIHRPNYPCHEKNRSQSFTLCNKKYSSKNTCCSTI